MSLSARVCGKPFNAYRDPVRCSLRPSLSCIHRRLVSTRACFDDLELSQQAQLNEFLDILLEENKKQNLTSVRDRDSAFEKHVLDSLSLLEVIDKAYTGAPDSTVRLLDVGSGPGLPGVIIAIARPTWKVCMFA